MVSLASLWLPILLSAVAVFIVSSIVHMVLPYHRADYGKLPNEDAVMDALRAAPPGDYMTPYGGSPAAMKDPAWLEKFKRGPMSVVSIMPRAETPSMARPLTQWFIYTLVVSLFAGYLASRTLAPGTEYLGVFRVTGTVAFAGYALGLAQNSIWFGRRWRPTLTSMFDGLLYALVTAGMFGWLWPK